MNKAQHEPIRSPLASAIANAIALVVLLGSSLATFAYLHLLQPLYGTAGRDLHLNKVVWAACIFGTLAPTLPAWPALLAGGLLVTAMPWTSYYVAVYTGRMGDVVWGPVGTHLVVLAPVIYLTAALVKALQETPDKDGMANAASMIGLPVCRMAIMTLQELWPFIPYVNQIDENSLLKYIGGFAITIWLISPFLTPTVPVAPPQPAAESVAPATPKSKKKGKNASGEKNAARAPTAPAPQKETRSGTNHSWRIMILPSIPLLLNSGVLPTLTRPLVQPWEHPVAPLRVLSAVRSSYSGVVLVGDILPPRSAEEEANMTYPHSLRYMRAGHSLLGGVWLNDRSVARDRSGPLAKDENGTHLGDSIYSTFVMQEAVRLAVQPDGSSPKTALTIGLGTGIAASSFIQHGLATTIVELDPAVYQAAIKYFGLVVPETAKVFLQDARRFVSRRANRRRENPDGGAGNDNGNSELFDIVVHDCFSGGGVPGHLFTLSFWTDLKELMSPSGIVAVNYAGKLNSDSSRAIVHTLSKVFGQCRAFHDSMETLSEEDLNNEFINWVFFCTPSTDAISFRAPVESDFLNSFLRERVLTTLLDREVSLSKIIGEISEAESEKFTLTDMKNPLVEWQDREALHHWKVMRQVLPDVFWETY